MEAHGHRILEVLRPSGRAQARQEVNGNGILFWGIVACVALAWRQATRNG